MGISPQRIHILLLQTLFRSKRFYLFLGILILFAIRTITLYVQSPNQGPDFASILIAIYYRVVDGRLMLYVIIPLFLLMTGLVSTMFDKYKVLLRYNSSKKWWKGKLFCVNLIAFICTFVILSLVLGALAGSGHIKDIDIDYFGFLALSTVMQLFGFLLIGTFYQVLTLIFSKPYISFFITFLSIVLSGVLKFLFKLTYITLPEYMSLIYKWTFEESTFAATDFVPIFSMCCAIAALYIVGSTLSARKDFYWSE